MSKVPWFNLIRRRPRAVVAGHALGARAGERLPGPGERRAVTLLETILAAALLAAISGTVLSVVGSMLSGEQRRRLQLASYEVANRLMLQYTDDPAQMPDKDAPYEYQPDVFFRYTLATRPLRLETPPDSVMEVNNWGGAQATLAQFVLLEVQVFLSNQKGDLIQPLVTLTRPYHPWPLYSSNPDARRRWFADPANIQRMTAPILEAVGAGGPTTPASGGTRPTTGGSNPSSPSTPTTPGRPSTPSGTPGSPSTPTRPGTRGVTPAGTGNPGGVR